MFAGQGGAGAGAGDILGSLGSLLAAGGAGGQGGINPQLLGQVVEVFSGLAGSKDDENNSVDDNNNEVSYCCVQCYG